MIRFALAGSVAGASLVALAASAPVSLAADIDLLAAGGNQIAGAVAVDHAGTSVSPAGDVNGDGLADVIVGAPDADNNGRSASGSAYVIYGSPGRSSIDLAGGLGAAGFRIDGAAASDFAGTSVAAAGDVNADGVDDVIVGAPQANPIAQAAGAAYVIYGQRTADPADVDLLALGNRGLVIATNFAGALMGTSVDGAGFFNNDSIADVVVGAHNNPGNQTGTVYVIYGQASADPSDVNVDNLALNEAARGMSILGAQGFAETGRDVSGVGDMAGDSRSDIAIAADAFDVPGRANVGQTFVIYGADLADPSDIALVNISAAEGGRGFVITGANAEDRFGTDLSVAGDFNADGRSDLIAGARNADFTDSTAGAAYVIYGANDSGDVPDLDLSSAATQDAWMRIDGDDSGDLAGSAVAGAGDVNGDGIADAIVGAPGADLVTIASDGAAYVVYGQALADPPEAHVRNIGPGAPADGRGFTIFRNQGATLGQLGGAVATAGDADGDGHSDVLVGDSQFAAGSPSRNQSGAAYLTAPEAPETAISGQGITEADPTFTLSSPTTGAAFECSLDSAAFTPCSSPLTLSGVSNGFHSLAARAVADGVLDTSPAEHLFFAAVPPAPVLGTTVNLRPVSGKVSVDVPKDSQGFVPIEFAVQVPVRTKVDVRAGRVAVTTATKKSRTQTAEFYDARFQIKQGKRNDLATMRLLDKPKCGGASGTRDELASRKRKPGLWGSGSGHFATQGAHGSASVRGTKWLIFDACGGITGTKVNRGRVVFRNFYTGRRTIVRAGETAIARPLARP